MIILRPNNGSHELTSLSGSLSGSLQGSILSSDARLSGSFNGSFRGFDARLNGDFSGSFGHNQPIPVNNLNGNFDGKFTGDGKQVVNIFKRIQIGNLTPSPVLTIGNATFNFILGEGLVILPNFGTSNVGRGLLNQLGDIPNIALANSTISEHELGTNLSLLRHEPPGAGLNGKSGLEINNSLSDNFTMPISEAGEYDGSFQRIVHFAPQRIETGLGTEIIETANDRFLIHDASATGDAQTVLSDIGNSSNIGAFLRVMAGQFGGTGLQADYTNAASGIVQIKRDPDVTYLSSIYAQLTYNLLQVGAGAGERRFGFGFTALRFSSDENNVKLNITSTGTGISADLDMQSTYNISNIGTLDEISDDLVSFTNVLGAWQGKGNSGNAPTYTAASDTSNRVEGIPQVIYGEWNGGNISTGNAMPLGNGSIESSFVFPLAGQILQITISYYSAGDGGATVTPISLDINGAIVTGVGSIDTSAQGTGHQSYALAEPLTAGAWDFNAGDRAEFKLGNVTSAGMNIDTNVAVVACIWFVME